MIDVSVDCHMDGRTDGRTDGQVNYNHKCVFVSLTLMHWRVEHALKSNENDIIAPAAAVTTTTDITTTPISKLITPSVYC